MHNETRASEVINQQCTERLCSIWCSGERENKPWDRELIDQTNQTNQPKQTGDAGGIHFFVVLAKPITQSPVWTASASEREKNRKSDLPPSHDRSSKVNR